MDGTAPLTTAPSLIDRFGRPITYLRLSVTDRCDLRCVYCMAARPNFLPRSGLLTLEELTAIGERFIARGVRKIRITGGEPLVRRDVTTLIGNLGRHVGASLDELTLTTNATRLALHAERLVSAGVKRVNVSLDTRDPARFGRLTRGGDLSRTLAGIEAGRRAGLQIKINTVALKGENENEIPDLVAWAHGQGFDMTLIEVMPVGDVGEDRADQFLPLTTVREVLESRWSLTDIPDRTGGPARYVRIAETGGRLGFITPLTGNFCAGCNRVRLTCTGQLYTCLGHDGALDLRSAYRDGGIAAIDARLDEAMAIKPERHDFDVSRGAGPAVNRHMAQTGG
ncbi:GTP 3',8-cyclase MoaA [Maricaulis sp.]|uniref:GTP 3',8-cyclase MoaA n=1 Tax=Maricaulis sp. TaxID=1486257 RepID=UPI0026235FF8|nr:GTP 3',8-cyclase MoaA [Maricaulis sp.]